MKKLALLAAALLLVNLLFAGGLLTNSNQSAQYVRMLSRNASLDIDAVYYNPAALTLLKDGWHFGLYNQTIFQDKKVNCEFPYLNHSDYLGKVTVPLYPNFYAAYKKENWAFSFGLGPVAGGGSAEFKQGLPSFEIPIAKIPLALQQLSALSAAGVVLDLPTGYDADLYFKGSSVYLGFQLGATYKINEKLSAFAGVRYVPASNKYSGNIQNIQFNVKGQMVPGSDWLNQTTATISAKSAEYANLAAQASAASTAFGSAATQLQPIVAGGGGAMTLTQLEAAKIINATQKAQLEGGLLAMGIPKAQVDIMQSSAIQVTYSGASQKMASDSQKAQGASTLLGGVATELGANASELGDKEVETEQTGDGWTPIIGLSIAPNDNWNIGLKYEHKTYVKLTNKTTVDDLGLFHDGQKTNYDVPGTLAIGVGYKGMDNNRMKVQASLTKYFDKGVYWGVNVRDLATWRDVDQSKIRMREIDHNSYELSLGGEYGISDAFSISLGGIYGSMDVADSYQSDFSYTNFFFGVGGGINWKLTDKLSLDAGVSNVFYRDDTVSFQDDVVSSYYDTYGKTSLSLAVGISYSIF